MASYTQSRSILAIVFAFALILCIAGVQADMDISDADRCRAIATALPELGTLTSNPWNIGNILACTAQGITCNSNNLVTSIIVTGLTSPVALPNIFGSFTALKTLTLDAPFTGDIPATLPASLDKLYLSSARFTGSIPSSFHTAANLRELSLGFDSSNMNPVFIPTRITGIGTVVEYFNGYFTSFPTAYGGIQSLTLFDCRFSAAVTVLPDAQIFTNYIIKSFNFSVDPAANFGASNVFPSDLRSMNSLVTLAIRGWAATGALPSQLPIYFARISIQDMPNLTGTIPGQLSRNAYTEFVNLPTVTGPIPSSGWNVPTKFIRYQNMPMINGGLQYGQFDLVNLEQFIMIDCPGITGTPPVNTRATMLKKIQVSGTGIFGTIPAYNIPTLESLTLDNNQLEAFADNYASVPLTNIKYFSISGNPGLVGTIPSLDLSSSTAASISITMKNNALTGAVPLSLAQNNGRTYDKFDFSGNKLNLCANSVTSFQGILRDLIANAGYCNLTTAGNPELLCADAWPTTCFYYPPVAPITPITPPIEPITPPIEPITPPIEPITPPVAVPIDAPVSVPVYIPVDAPVKVPVDVPVDAPVSVPVDVPVDAPITPPVAVPIDAPVSAPVDVPVDAPGSVPVDTPQAIPQAAPQVIPQAIPVSTPVVPTFEPTAAAAGVFPAFGLFIVMALFAVFFV